MRRFSLKLHFEPLDEAGCGEMLERIVREKAERDRMDEKN
jgi:hypothetical protein